MQVSPIFIVGWPGGSQHGRDGLVLEWQHLSVDQTFVRPLPPTLKPKHTQDAPLKLCKTSSLMKAIGTKVHLKSLAAHQLKQFLSRVSGRNLAASSGNTADFSGCAAGVSRDKSTRAFAPSLDEDDGGSSGDENGDSGENKGAGGWGASLLRVLLEIRHEVRAAEKGVTGGQKLAFEAEAITISQQPVHGDSNESGTDDSRRNSDRVKSASASPQHATGAEPSIFFFEATHASLRPDSACKLPASHSAGGGAPGRVRSESRPANTFGVPARQRRGSSFSEGAHLDLSGRASPRSIEHSPELPTSRRKSSGAHGEEGHIEGSEGIGAAAVKCTGSDDSDDDSESGEETSRPLRRSSSARYGGHGVSEPQEESDSEDEDEKSALRTEVEVRELRCVYSLALRDRLMLFVEIWQRIQAKNETDIEEGSDSGDSGDRSGLNVSPSKQEWNRQSEMAAAVPVDHLSALFLSKSAGQSEVQYATAKAEAAAAAAASAHAAAAAATFESTIRYRVKFLNPQVNLLCPKTNGSLILGVAEASLVGRDLGVFYTCPREEAGTADSAQHEGAATSSGFGVYINHERLLVIDSALAYVASMDVDMAAGICWLKDVKDPRRNESNVLLRQIMKPFGVRQRHEVFEPVSRKIWRNACHAMTKAVRRAAGGNGEGLAGMPRISRGTAVASAHRRRSSEFFEPPVVEVASLAERLRVDLGDLSLDLDSTDFEKVSDAVRNVLLAPPYEPAFPGRQSDAERIAERNKEYHVVSPSSSGFAAAAAAQAASSMTWGGGSTFDGGSGARWGGRTKDQRYTLKAVVEETLIKLKSERLNPRLLRVVEYELGTGKWLLRPLADVGRTIDLIEVGFSGLSGKHQFLSDQTVESLVSLDALWILNKKPGPTSLGFADPMVILKPRRYTNPLCRHCTQPFTPETNGCTACLCHANSWGEEGFFGPKSHELCRSVSVGEQKPSLRAEWTCCGGSHLRAPKCSARQHATNMPMILVQASQPKPLLIGGLVVHVFNELQVSVFPEEQHPIGVQLSSDVASALNAYFFRSDDASSGAQSGSSMSGSSFLLGEHAGAMSGSGSLESAPGASLGTSFFGSSVGGQHELPGHESSNSEDEGGGTASEGPSISLSDESGGDEVVYLKYLRIGDVSLEVTTVGFGKKLGVTLDREALSLVATNFLRSGKVLTWKQLGQKYTKHLASNLISSRKAPPKPRPAVAPAAADSGAAAKVPTSAHDATDHGPSAPTTRPSAPRPASSLFSAVRSFKTSAAVSLMNAAGKKPSDAKMSEAEKAQALLFGGGR